AIPDKTKKGSFVVLTFSCHTIKKCYLCIVRQIPMPTMRQLFSLVYPVQEKPPCRLTLAVNLLAMTNMDGAIRESSILKEAAMLSVLTWMPKKNPKSTMPFALVLFW